MTNRIHDESVVSADSELTAQQTADIIQAFSKLLEHSPAAAPQMTRALEHVAKGLRRNGKSPIGTVKILGVQKKRVLAPIDLPDFSHAPLDNVKSLLRSGKMTRAELVHLARSRFGISRSRLTRMSLEEAQSIVTAAADHEDSLRIIESNAHESGAQRKS